MQAAAQVPSGNTIMSLLRTKCSPAHQADMAHRHRQMYEYLIFLDRDEFLHFVDTPPTAVNLAWEFHSRLADTLYTSLVFMTAVYRVRCLVEAVHDLAEHSVHLGAESGARMLG